MTLTIAPPRIEATDFSAGFCPDLEVGAIPHNGLLEVQNLLPDAVTGQPQTREGYKRVAGFAVAGYTVKSLHPFNKTDGSRYLIAVLSSGTDVRVYSYNLKTQVAAQISPGGKTWLSLDGIHYGFTNGDKFYGGSEKDPMYSWNGTTWVDDASAIAHTAFSATKAYKKGDTVSYNSKNYACTTDWRETDWENLDSYVKGDKVSITVSGEPRTFKARKDHDSTGTNAPGLGTQNSGDHWKLLRMLKPTGIDGKPTKHWTEIASAPKTQVAVFHGNRMYGRHDNKQRIVYNEQANLAPDLTLESVSAQWSPTKWSITDLPISAGFQDFTTPSADRIMGLHSYGRNLLVFKERSVHVISGYDPNTWIVRQIGNEGTISSRAFAELDGFVYFISPDGFNVTDGTEIRPAPGSDKVQDYIKECVSWDGATNVVMWTWNNMVWIAHPHGPSKVNNHVLVYDPSTGSFWKLDLHVVCTAINNIEGVDQLFFGVPTKIGTFASASYIWNGTPHESSSRITWTASPVHVVESVVINPSFEKAFDIGWSKTTENLVTWDRTPESAYVGSRGIEVTCKANADNNHGIRQTITFPTIDTYKFSVKVRRPDWKKNPKKEPKVSLYMDGVLVGGQTFDNLGGGWFRLTGTVGIGSLTPRIMSIRVFPGHTVQMDNVMLYIVTAPGEEPPDFDGDGGEDQQPPPPVDSPGDVGSPGDVVDTGTFEGGTGLIMQYAHPESNYTDDTGQTAYASRGITWWLHTAWFSFSSAKEIRRCRRTWALVRGTVETILRGYYNFRAEPIYEVTQTSDNGEEATHFEGRMLPDSHAVSFAIAGYTAPAAVLGVAADTEFRRTDYHNR